MHLTVIVHRAMLVCMMTCKEEGGDRGRGWDKIFGVLQGAMVTRKRENTCRCVRSLDSVMRMRDSRFPEDLTQFSLVLHYRHQKLVHFVKRYFALLDARLEDVYRVIN